MMTIKNRASRVVKVPKFFQLPSLSTIQVYLLSSAVKAGKALKTKRKKIPGPTRISFKFTPEVLLKFWGVFGIIAFLTTSLSFFPALSGLLMLPYFALYVASIVIAPISLLIFWRKRKEALEANEE